jgi:membrane protein YdbS with pleckstrin-like domain
MSAAEHHLEPPAPSGTPSAERILEFAKLLLERNRPRESEALFRRLLERGERVVDAAYGVGLTRLAAGDLDAAASYFRDVLRRAPGHANALYQLGVVAGRRGSAADARAYFERVLALQPAHAGARAELGGAMLTPTVQPRPAAAPGGPYGVYEYLLRDPSPLSRTTIATMDALRMKRTPSVIAYAGRYTRRFTLLVALPLVIASVLSNDRVASALPPAVRARVDVSQIAGLVLQSGLVLAAVAAAVGVVRVLTTRVTIERGRLQIHRGVLARRLVNVELWRVRNIEVDRTLLNRVTRDGTLVLHVMGEPGLRRRRRKPRRGAAAHPDDDVLELTGIARGRRLEETYQQLLNLVFLLRSNPVIKGIIQ